MSSGDGGPRLPQVPQDRYFPAAFWAVLALTAVIRSIGIARPLLGDFATKNAVYGMIARNFARGTAADVWHPTLDVLVGGQRSWHLLEFPVSAYVTGWLWDALGGSLDVWGRATSVVFSIGSVAVMFLFVRRRHGQTAAVAAALALALSPVGIIYGQSFMLEASLVFFALGTFYALDRWLDGGRCGWLVAAGVCLALLLLTKIYMLVVLLPLAVMVFRSSRGSAGAGNRAGGAGVKCSGAPANRRRPWLHAMAVAAVAVVPATLWYAFAFHTASPEGPFANRVFDSVRRSVAVHGSAYWRLGSADFYRQVLDDLTGVVLTPVGFVLAMAGLLDRRWREHLPWLLAVLVLVLALPLKFSKTNYYYMAALPPLCIMIGLGWQVIRQRLRLGRPATVVLLLSAAILSLRYAVGPAFVTPEEDRGVPAAARAVRELTAENEPIVTMHGTTIDLLYHCDRRGWAVGPERTDLESVLADCRRQGANYLVVVGRRPPALSPRAAFVQRIDPGEDFRIYRLSDF